MINLNRILFPTDFSETSHCAMGYAIEFAKAFNAKLDIVHVLFDETQVVAFYLPQVTFQNMDQEIEAAAKKQLDEFVDAYPKIQDVDYSVSLIKGTPFLEIIQTAKTQKSDMIIIGTHGRSGIEHVLFGSTAEKVVRKAPCPVFTVRKEGQEFVMP